MSTLIQTINKKIDEQSFNLFAIITFQLLVGSAIAGIAAMMILKNDAPTWQLAVIAFSAILSNALSIGQAGLRAIIWGFFINVILSVGLIILNLF